MSLCMSVHCLTYQCIPLCVCVLCVHCSFFFFFFLGCVNGLVMFQAASSEQGKARFFVFCFWSAPLSGERGDMSCHSPFRHCSHKSSHTPQRPLCHRRIYTHWCTFVCTEVTFTHEAIQGCMVTEVRVMLCADISTHKDRYMHIQSSGATGDWMHDIRTVLKVHCEIADWQASQLTAGTTQNILGSHMYGCFDCWASVAYSLTWFTIKLTRKKQDNSAVFI